uniref:Kringle domain-containing protein n=1 Tax=Macrostomum lignano TaxID=282301 RepID=A0A1I8FIK5_9PLAT
MPCQNKRAVTGKAPCDAGKKNYVFMGTSFSLNDSKLKCLRPVQFNNMGPRCWRRDEVHPMPNAVFTSAAIAMLITSAASFRRSARPATGGSLRGQAGEQPGNSAAKPQ